jgi:regulation of enolase protein 1 (concanavalin A-like superfamily)
MFLNTDKFLKCARLALFITLLGSTVSSEVSAQSVPSPWTAKDIGSPAIASTVTYSAGTYTVNEAGVDIWNTSDQFHFIYQQIVGDADVRVRVRSLSQANSWSKTGVMIRETLSPGSRHAFALLSAAQGYGYQRRIDPNGFSEAGTGVTGVSPGWVRLVRSGSRIEAFRSADGVTWISLGADVVPMVETVYVGIATTSHNATVKTKAVLDSLTVTGTPVIPPPAGNTAPTVALTAPASGATYSAPASVALAATASDADGSVAKVEFYSGATLLGTDTSSPYSFTWSSVPAGSYSLTATAYDNTGAKTTSAARTITVTGTSSAIPAPWVAGDVGSPALSGSSSYSGGIFSVTAGGVDIWDTSDQFHFVYQAVAGDLEIVARVDSLTNVQPYTSAGVMIRGALTGNANHGYATVIANGGVYFRHRLTTGASTTYNLGVSTAAPVWVRLVRKGTLVTSYSSTDGATWTTVGSQTIAMSSTVYVGLATNGHSTATRTTAKFSNVRISTSTSNQLPVVSLTAPASGATYTAPASVALTATASDTDGTIAKVEFYSGATLVGTDTSSPYSFTWSSVPAGTYSLTAVAYDNVGAKTTSAARSITVTGTTTPPPTTPPTSIVFQKSVDHTAVTSYRLDVFASGANPATATPVATSDLGKPTPASNGDITVDRASFFSALAVGNYVATVSAIGTGGSSRSASVTFSR